MSKAGTDPVLTFKVTIARNGNVTNDVLTHGCTFAEVYWGMHEVKRVVQRQIDERRMCPYNPKNCALKEPEFKD